MKGGRERGRGQRVRNTCRSTCDPEEEKEESGSLFSQQNQPGLKGFLQIWYKFPLGLEEELIRNWRAKVKGQDHCDLTVSHSHEGTWEPSAKIRG